jgi:Bacterial transcriptional activator domain
MGLVAHDATAAGAAGQGRQVSNRATRLAGIPSLRWASRARRLVRLAPYRESGYRLLMRALERTGEDPDALLVYEQLRTVLHDELGTTPSMLSQTLHRRLLGSAS